MDTTELKNTYRIIQDKLTCCQNEKRNITAKKTTKRTLLQESQHVLENHLANALTEDMLKKRNIALDSNQGNLIPIISSSASRNADSLLAQAPPIIRFNMVKCHGWIINRKRVWLQAQYHALNSTQAHLCCLPNKLLPETTCLNMVCNNDESQHLFLCFDLMPDVQIEEIKTELKAYCNYQYGSQTLSSETCSIEWFDDKNLSWFDSLSISTSQVTLQAYFPCHVGVKVQDSYHLDQLMKHSQPLNHQFSYIEDQCVLIQANGKNIDIYALSFTSINFILNMLNNVETASSSRETTRDLIMSTGEYYVSPNYKTRAKVSLIASQLFAI